MGELTVVRSGLPLPASGPHERVVEPEGADQAQEQEASQHDHPDGRDGAQILTAAHGRASHGLGRPGDRHQQPTEDIEQQTHTPGQREGDKGGSDQPGTQMQRRCQAGGDARDHPSV